MVTFLITVGIVFLSTFVGSAIAWAIAKMMLGAIEMGVGRPAVRVEVPVSSAATTARSVHRR